MPLIASHVSTMRRPSTILTSKRTTRHRRVVPLNLTIHVGRRLLTQRQANSSNTPTLLTNSPSFQEYPVILTTRQRPTLRNMLTTFTNAHRVPMSIRTRQRQRINLLRVHLRLIRRHTTRPHRPHRTNITMHILHNRVITRLK